MIFSFDCLVEIVEEDVRIEAQELIFLVDILSCASRVSYLTLDCIACYKVGCEEKVSVFSTCISYRHERQEDAHLIGVPAKYHNLDSLLSSRPVIRSLDCWLNSCTRNVGISTRICVCS